MLEWELVRWGEVVVVMGMWLWLEWEWLWWEGWWLRPVGELELDVLRYGFP
jgi:hypothetical protein